jgi:hypothetical protein
MEGNEYTEGSPSRPEKRGLETVVTPNDEAGKEERNKIARSKYSLKVHHEVSPKNMMSSKSEGFMIRMRGNIDLFFVDQGQTEAFVNPIIELLFEQKNTRYDDRFKREQLYAATKIIAVVPRRVSLKSDEPEMKGGSPTKDGNAKFKKHYFVSLGDPEDSQEEKKKRLQSVLEVRWGDYMLKYGN